VRPGLPTQSTRLRQDGKWYVGYVQQPKPQAAIHRPARTRPSPGSARARQRDRTPLGWDEVRLTLRTRIKRLARKTICFSKSPEMHDIVIGLFVNRYEFGLSV